jgi:hypothetical protein
MWEPRRLTTLWAFTACYRDSFTFTYAWERLFILCFRSWIANVQTTAGALRCPRRGPYENFKIFMCRNCSLATSKHLAVSLYERNDSSVLRNCKCSEVFRGHTGCGVRVQTVATFGGGGLPIIRYVSSREIECAKNKFLKMSWCAQTAKVLVIELFPSVW